MVAPEKRYRKPAVFKDIPGLVAAESTRHGGVSPSPYASLNLGLFTQDSSANVQKNRRLFFESLQISPNRIVSLHQVHGDQVLVATAPGQYDGYDAVITREPDLFLTVTVADCAPILIYDSAKEAVAAVHAGWRGARAGIVTRTLQSMQDLFGTAPVNCLAYIGPCIDCDSYEVDADVADFFEERYKKWDEEKGKFLLDLKRVNLDQLLAAKIPEKQIEVSPHSTVAHNEDYFSYRAEGPMSGRMVGVIGMIC